MERRYFGGLALVVKSAINDGNGEELVLTWPTAPLNERLRHFFERIVRTLPEPSYQACIAAKRDAIDAVAKRRPSDYSRLSLTA